MSTRLSAGDTAPAFTLSDADGRDISLSDFAGGRVVVYFYPAALTPGCTTQAIDFTGARDALAAGGVQVVGISPDPVTKLARFADAEGIAIPLLSDPDRVVLNAYAAYGERVLYGKKVEGVIRSTFVVDVDATGLGTIAEAQYNVKATGHVDRLRRVLGV